MPRVKQSNALRFINAYNQIEQSLKTQNNFKNSISYTEAVRLAARNNGIVRKYEDDLIDYGRLRNSIVHSSGDHVIAEPYDDVVENYEKIAKLISSPPLAINTVCVKDVKCMEAHSTLRDVMINMYKSGFSNYPIYHNGMLIGVANASRLTKMLGSKLFNKEDLNSVALMPIGELVKNGAQENFYAIADSKITLDRVLNLFAENRKLQLIIITNKGTLLEMPIGVIAVADILDINKVLDNYE